MEGKENRGRSKNIQKKKFSIKKVSDHESSLIYLHAPFPAPIMKLPLALPPLPVIAAVLSRTASRPTMPLSLGLPSPTVVLR